MYLSRFAILICNNSVFHETRTRFGTLRPHMPVRLVPPSVSSQVPTLTDPLDYMRDFHLFVSLCLCYMTFEFLRSILNVQRSTPIIISFKFSAQLYGDNIFLSPYKPLSSTFL